MSPNSRNLLLVIIMLAGFVTPGPGADGKGGQAGAFLRLGAGARASAMGNAYTSVADEASAIYWNPASLGFLPRPQLLGMYSALSLERRHSFVAYAQPNLIKGFSIGAGWLHSGVGEIDGRDAFGNPSEKFDNAENAFLFGVAWRRSFLAVGATAKYLRHSLANNSASGSSLDIGLQLRLKEFLAIGFVAQDLFGEMKWNTPAKTLAELPAVLRGGVRIRPVALPVLLSGEVVRLDGELALHAGMEYRLLKALGMRAGYNDGQLAVGGFIAIPASAFHVQLDYAFSNDVLDEGAVHRVALLLEF